MANIEELRRQYAVKSNELIQKSRYTMTAQQYDLLTYLISMVKKSDEPGKLYTISIMEFCRLCHKYNDGGWYYQSIKKDLKIIADTSVYVLQPNGKEKLVRWLDEVIIDRGSGIMEVSFHRNIYPYLYDLTERYTMLCVEYILPLSTFHAKRLYEILRSYLITPQDYAKDYIAANGSEDFRHREYKTARTFELNALRREMFCDTYESYYDFSRYVLKKAVEEINRFTDIEITFDGKTSKGNGRKITHIAFTIKLVNRVFFNDDRLRNREIFYYDEAREDHTDENGNIMWHTFEDGKVKHITKDGN